MNKVPLSNFVGVGGWTKSRTFQIQFTTKASFLAPSPLIFSGKVNHSKPRIPSSFIKKTKKFWPRIGTADSNPL